MTVKVLSAFRTDMVFAIESKHTFQAYLEKLGAPADVHVASYQTGFGYSFGSVNDFNLGPPFSSRQPAWVGTTNGLFFKRIFSNIDIRYADLEWLIVEKP